MTVVAPAWPAGTDRGRPSGLFPADCRWDRRVALLDSETAALLALGPVRLRRNGAVGIPRRTALHWRALTRLTGPLDAAVAGLHHGDDVRFRRAGRQAVAIVLQHCADTGRAGGAGRRGSGRGCAAAAPASSSPRSRCRPSRRCARSWWRWPICSAGSPTFTRWARSIDFTWPA